MNGYLLDTNVLSALRRPKLFPQVSAWIRPIDSADLHISVITMGEIRHGIERKAVSDPAQARVLDQWYRTLLPFYGEKILPVDLQVAEKWGELGIHQPLSVANGIIAASALVHGLTLITRNVSDFAPHGVQVLNPF